MEDLRTSDNGLQKEGMPDRGSDKLLAIRAAPEQCVASLNNIL